MQVCKLLTEQELIPMVTKIAKTKPQKTSRGQRKHVRRMKQESRKTGIPENQLKKRLRPPEGSKKEA